MKIFALVGSMRNDSINKQLLRRVQHLIEAQGHTVDFATLADFDIPHYNGDIEVASGIPEGVQQIAARIGDADGLIIASPEYNFSMPGVLKNAIDWVSRVRPLPLRGHTAFLVAASPSVVGGIRGLWQLRIPLEGLGTTVMPSMFALAEAHKGFADDGSIANEKLDELLTNMTADFLASAQALKNK